MSEDENEEGQLKALVQKLLQEVSAVLSHAMLAAQLGCSGSKLNGGLDCSASCCRCKG
jgi:hypothetical protein